MNQQTNNNAGRPRTALVRVLLILFGRDWEDTEFEEEQRYSMQQFPWLRLEAYAAAVVVAIFGIGFSTWLVSRIAEPPGILFWFLIPIALIVSFIGVQLLVWGCSILAEVLKFRDVKVGISLLVLLVFTVIALGICLFGGALGLIAGSVWLAVLGLNGVAAAAEKILTEK